ncbi:MAG: polyamine ABC transporter ATP-binding protein [Candidatus Improbicoccus devescovinae]|nr:MAG: polyamine ABC transporter ATP-binding protein [Candidatus Improbicoccus devescovinae]
MIKNILEFKNVSMKLGKEYIFKNLNLRVARGEFVTLLGPSGCGKTTILRLIGGFLAPDDGYIIFDGKNINKLPPHKRQVNTVFQKYALFNHLNVYENVAFGLKLKKISSHEINDRVNKMLEMVNLKGFGDRNIDSLSGGQQQRVAVARALVNKPTLLLLDEPLAALDLKLRKDMQIELKKLQKHTGITFVFVTHDQEEALSMSDTVVVMNKGIIQQVASPEIIYNEPKNAFVADFIGESNIINGKILGDFCVNFASKTFKCLDSGFTIGESVDVVIRPEDIKIVDPSKSCLVGIVSSVIFKGVYNEIIVDVDNFKWMAQTTQYYAPGTKIGLNLTPDDIHIMKKSEYSLEVGDYSAFSDEFYEERHV